MVNAITQQDEIMKPERCTQKNAIALGDGIFVKIYFINYLISVTSPFCSMVLPPQSYLR